MFSVDPFVIHITKYLLTALVNYALCELAVKMIICPEAVFHILRKSLYDRKASYFLCVSKKKVNIIILKIKIHSYQALRLKMCK